MEKRKKKNTTYSKLTFQKNENLGIEESQLICGGAVFLFSKESGKSTLQEIKSPIVGMIYY